MSEEVSWLCIFFRLFPHIELTWLHIQNQNMVFEEQIINTQHIQIDSSSKEQGNDFFSVVEQQQQNNVNCWRIINNICGWAKHFLLPTYFVQSVYSVTFPRIYEVKRVIAYAATSLNVVDWTDFSFTHWWGDMMSMWLMGKFHFHVLYYFSEQLSVVICWEGKRSSWW